jgi:hypothetical protein
MSDSESSIERLSASAVKYVAGGIAGLVVATTTTLLRHFARPVYESIRNEVPKDSLIQVVYLLFLVCLLLCVWIRLLYRERRKPLADRFEFDDYGGYYVDPRNGRAVCPSCLAEGKVVNMMDVSGNKMCNACKTACRGKTTAKSDIGN